MATLLNIKRVRIIAVRLPAIGVPYGVVKSLNDWADAEEKRVLKIEKEKRASISQEVQPEPEPTIEPAPEPVSEPSVMDEPNLRPASLKKSRR